MTDIELWSYSNYLDWIGKRSGQLVDRAFIQSHFGTAEAYQLVVRSYLTREVYLPIGLGSYLDEL